MADRFAPWAFAFPVVWLLFNRLWIEALVAFALSLVIDNDDSEFGFVLAGPGLGCGAVCHHGAWRGATGVRRRLCAGAGKWST
jgi:hypothetical protein